MNAKRYSFYVMFALICLNFTSSWAGNWTNVWGPVADVVMGYDDISGKTTMYATIKASQNNQQYLYKYGGTPRSWRVIGNPLKRFAADQLGNVYGLPFDGKAVQMLSRTAAGPWRDIGTPNGVAVDTLFSGSSGVYAIESTTKDVYFYHAYSSYHPDEVAWKRMGGPGSMFAADTLRLFGISPTKDHVWKFLGFDSKSRPQWESIGGGRFEHSYRVEFFVWSCP